MLVRDALRAMSANRNAGQMLQRDSNCRIRRLFAVAVKLSFFLSLATFIIRMMYASLWDRFPA